MSMIIKGECRICHKNGSIIDTIAICSECILKAIQDPGISHETRQGLKWLCNMQYGAIRNIPVKQYRSQQRSIDDPRGFGSPDPLVVREGKGLYCGECENLRPCQHVTSSGFCSIKKDFKYRDDTKCDQFSNCCVNT